MPRREICQKQSRFHALADEPWQQVAVFAATCVQNRTFFDALASCPALSAPACATWTNRATRAARSKLLSCSSVCSMPICRRSSPIPLAVITGGRGEAPACDVRNRKSPTAGTSCGALGISIAANGATLFPVSDVTQAWMFVMAYWAAAQLQPQRDQLALHCLKLFGFETYAPRLRDRRTIRGPKVIKTPLLFPGYVLSSSNCNGTRRAGRRVSSAWSWTGSRRPSSPIRWSPRSRRGR